MKNTITKFKNDNIVNYTKSHVIILRLIRTRTLIWICFELTDKCENNLSILTMWIA